MTAAVSAGPGIEQLREQLAALDDALESYGDPVVAEHPGLGLMHRTLTERAQHIRSTIAEAETSHLILTLEGAPLENGLPARALERLLGGCRKALATLLEDAQGEVAELSVAAVSSEGAKVSIRLSGPIGPLSAQPTDGQGHLLLDAALARLVAGLAGTDEQAAGALAPLAKALDDLPVILTVELDAPTVEAAEVTCEAATLERLRTAG